MITVTSVRTLWSSFRLGESTIRLIIRNICNAIINNMKNVYIRTPTTEEWENIARGFNNKTIKYRRNRRKAYQHLLTVVPNTLIIK